MNIKNCDAGDCWWNLLCSADHSLCNRGMTWRSKMSRVYCVHRQKQRCRCDDAHRCAALDQQSHHTKAEDRKLMLFLLNYPVLLIQARAVFFMVELLRTEIMLSSKEGWWRHVLLTVSRLRPRGFQLIRTPMVSDTMVPQRLLCFSFAFVKRRTTVYGCSSNWIHIPFRLARC